MSHILVVDDDPAIRDVVVDILEMADYEVRTASNGAEALRSIEAELPSAVLIDLMMPVMNGWEFLRQWRRLPTCRQVPVVLMSAASDAPGATELGVQGFLDKPFELEAVLALIAGLTDPTLSAASQAARG